MPLSLACTSYMAAWPQVHLAENQAAGCTENAVDDVPDQPLQGKMVYSRCRGSAGPVLVPYIYTPCTCAAGNVGWMGCRCQACISHARLGSSLNNHNSSRLTCDIKIQYRYNGRRVYSST